MKTLHTIVLLLVVGLCSSCAAPFPPWVEKLEGFDTGTLEDCTPGYCAVFAVQFTGAEWKYGQLGLNFNYTLFSVRYHQNAGMVDLTVAPEGMRVWLVNGRSYRDTYTSTLSRLPPTATRDQRARMFSVPPALNETLKTTAWISKDALPEINRDVVEFRLVFGMRNPYVIQQVAL